ncbi:MAG: HlyD family efflux transporter periplasmic adaptor subunit [Eubacteriales bacterium]|nr:HlyD family efflux transporter periplasmic adaptor subunit [Eubacteriales bacterium]
MQQKNVQQKNFLHQLLIGAIAILVIAYMVLQLKLSVGDLLTVQTVELATYEETYEATGYIIRNEKIISSTTTGEISYLVRDNQKVSSNTNLLAIYSNPSDAELQNQVNVLKNKIAVLEKSASSMSNNIVAIDDSINSLMLQSIRKIESNSITGALFGADDLLITMNRKAALKGTIDFKTLKQTLEHEVTYLENSMSGQKTVVRADRAGYFYSTVDGYESVFLPSALDKMSLENYETLVSSKPNLIASNTAVGKIVYDSKWYIICKINKKVTGELRAGRTYDFEYLHTNNLRIPMTFERSISRTDSDDVIAIFHSQEMPDDFSFKREQPLKIVMKSYEGLEVPTGAIRRRNGESGVYIVKGNIVLFRKVEILYERRGSFICKLPDDKDKAAVSKTDLSLYDMIIIGGKNIYDGKVLK